MFSCRSTVFRGAVASAALVSAALLAGCSTSSNDATTVESAYTVIAAPELLPGDAIPAPRGEVVLVVTGKIGNTNVGDEAHFDLATLERLGLVEYSVDDQQAEGRVVTFRGVLVSDLLRIVGADQGATMLRTTALNDYAVDIPAEDAATYPMMIATSVDGERMSVARYGPTRVVYPTSSFDFDAAIYEPRWIWQLASIEVS